MDIRTLAPTAGAVPRGPRAYRTRVRTLGPLAALIPPALIGAAGLLLLRDNTSLARGVGGFLAALFAAPLLPVLGAPIRSGSGVYLAAVAGSAVVWMVLGLIAARRATRRPVATWRDFWREYTWMAVGVWVGVGLSLLASNLVLGRALL